MTIDITQIAVALIGLATTVLTGFLIPLIRSKLNEKQNEIFDSCVKIAVYAAEQLYGVGNGDQKKDYVLNFLHDQGYDVKQDIVNVAIESAVKELKLSIG